MYGNWLLEAAIARRDEEQMEVETPSPAHPFIRLDEKPCAHCGKLFKPRFRERKYCSKACWQDIQAKRVPIVTCEHCGQPFRRRQTSYLPRRFCSRECGYAYARGKPRAAIALESKRAHERAKNEQNATTGL